MMALHGNRCFLDFNLFGAAVDYQGRTLQFSGGFIFTLDKFLDRFRARQVDPRRALIWHGMGYNRSHGLKLARCGWNQAYYIVSLDPCTCSSMHSS